MSRRVTPPPPRCGLFNAGLARTGPSSVARPPAEDMAEKLLFVLLLGVVAGLPENYGLVEPPPVSSYSLPKPAASGPEARSLTVPQPLPYRFEYEVVAPETGDHKSASEWRAADGVVRGEYSYVDPTGSLRTVRYTASDLTGFVVQQEVVPGFAEPPPAGAAPQPRTAEPDQTEGEAEEAKKEGKKREEEEKLKMKREQEAKMKREEEEERKKKQEAEQKREEEAERKTEEEAQRKRKEEAERKREEEAERNREEEAERKREEEAEHKKEERAERKKKEEARLQKEKEEAERNHQDAEKSREYDAEKRREREAARERERRRRLFGLAPPRLVLPTPLLVASPTLTLLRTRAARPPPVTAVRIQGRGIDIAY